MNEKESKKRSPEPIQGSDKAILIIVLISLIGLFFTLIFISPEDEIERRFVLLIMGISALIGIFYLATRFFNMYSVLKGTKAVKISLVLMLLIFILFLAFIGNLNKYMYYSIISAFIGFIAGLGFDKYIFP